VSDVFPSSDFKNRSWTGTRRLECHPFTAVPFVDQNLINNSPRRAGPLHPAQGWHNFLPVANTREKNKRRVGCLLAGCCGGAHSPGDVDNEEIWRWQTQAQGKLSAFSMPFTTRLSLYTAAVFLAPARTQPALWLCFGEDHSHCPHCTPASPAVFVHATRRSSFSAARRP